MTEDDATSSGTACPIAVDALALMVVFAALVMPERLGQFSPFAFVLAPIELVLGVALVLALPTPLRQVVAAVLGALLAVTTLLKIIDLGFYESLGRPFDPVLDLGLLDDAVRLLLGSSPGWDEIGIAAATAVVLIMVMVGLVLAVLRLAGTAVGHRALLTRAVTVATAGWLALALTGAQLQPGRPIASSAETAMVIDRAEGLGRGLTDRSRFQREASVDAFAGVPADQLLTGLRGKDVVLALVESYGRSALDEPGLGPQVGALLDSGTHQLNSAGFGSRSAYLTSSTAGGGSWLAQSTLLSGLWIDSQLRYRELVASERLTLPGAFARAGWSTVAVAPGTTRPWPEATFFGYRRVYDEAHLGYRGPSFSWAAMPDQYTLAQFQRTERAPGHEPVMAVVPLVSSHAPWSPLPGMIDWSDVGEGSVYDAMAAPGSPPEVILTRDPEEVRADYARAVQYSLESLISYVREFGDEDLVLVLVGDHQPSPVVTGDHAGRDVPITIVARDPAVLARVDGWDWTAGLRPAADAPVWRMDEFRDRFLYAFGAAPVAGTHHR